MKLDTINYQLERKLNDTYDSEMKEWYDSGCDYDEPEMSYIDFHLIINDELIRGTTDYRELINTTTQRQCYESEYHLPEHNVEIRNSHEYSHWYVFTCSCGIAGCAGIWDGIHLKVRKHTVEWRVGKNMGYDFLGKRYFQFDRKGYFKMLDEIKQEINQ